MCVSGEGQFIRGGGLFEVKINNYGIMYINEKKCATMWASHSLEYWQMNLQITNKNEPESFTLGEGGSG